MKARVFNIMQYEYHPNDYEDDGSLKQGAEPLITHQMIKDGLNHRSIKQWAYIWHDKDVLIEDGLQPKLKPKHVHIVLSCPSQIELQSVAKWFGIPENFVDVPKGRGAFLDCVEYLTHESTKEQESGKHRYDDAEVFANFDFRAELTVRAQRQARYGYSTANRMSATDEMKLRVMLDGWTMKQCRDSDPLVYIKVRDTLPKLRLDYLLDQPPCPFRMNIYVDGNGGLGKGALCEYIAQALFPEVEKPFFAVGNDVRVAFDGYDGEPVIIWDDYRAAQFIKNFGRGGVFNIFDTHPRQQAQQAKNSRVVLTNAVNIVNSVEPYMKFMDSLAGEYKDRDGIQHVAEDKNQAYRRFPLIMCVRERDFDVLFNRGFVDKDSHAYQQYDRYECVRGSLKQVITQLDGKAKSHVLADMTRPALDCYNMLAENHDNKISDPDLIPDEFIGYGTLVEPADMAEEEEIRKLNHLFRFADEYVKRFGDTADMPEFYYNAMRMFDWNEPNSRRYFDNNIDLFNSLPQAEKEQILKDVASFTPGVVCTFVMQAYKKG